MLIHSKIDIFGARYFYNFKLAFDSKQLRKWLLVGCTKLTVEASNNDYKLDEIMKTSTRDIFGRS